MFDSHTTCGTHEHLFAVHHRTIQVSWLGQETINLPLPDSCQGDGDILLARSETCGCP